MATYDGLDLLTIMPNVRTAKASTVARPVVAAENPAGNVLTQTTDAPPGGTWQLDWHCVTRAERVAVETFLAARLGQSQACWVPTYQQDVALVAVNGFGEWDVTASAITSLPATEFAYRRWIVLSPQGLTYRAVYWDSASDNGDGTWHWSVSPGNGNVVATMAGTLLSSQGARVSRLMRCRLTSDSYHVTYHTGDKTTVSAEVVEVAGDLTS
jgi:hypothetical protein